MFPGANAQIYRNEVGEVIGWDYPSDEPYDSPYDDDDWYAQNYEEELEELEFWECEERGIHGDSGFMLSGVWWCWLTDNYEEGHDQGLCDYCGEVFWHSVVIARWNGKKK